MSKIHLEKLNSRPLSWSSISSFEWNPNTWAKKYLEGIEEPKSAELIFGSWCGGKLEKDPTFLPQIERQSKMEQGFNVNLGGIKLVGYADTFCDKTFKKLGEFKTANTKNEWTQKKVDKHGQLTLYVLFIYITYKIKPEDIEIKLWWMPTKKEESGNFDVKISFVDNIEENIKMFKTKRTMVDILKFAQYIQETYKAMEEFALNYEPGV